MPRRAQVRQACTRCREKRAKCDGHTPCARCKTHDEGCSYQSISWTSKESLRSEVRKLRGARQDSRALMKALVSNKSRESVVETLREGEIDDDTLARLFRLLDDDDDDDAEDDEEDDLDDNDVDDACNDDGEQDRGSDTLNARRPARPPAPRPIMAGVPVFIEPSTTLAKFSLIKPAESSPASLAETSRASSSQGSGASFPTNKKVNTDESPSASRRCSFSGSTDGEGLATSVLANHNLEPGQLRPRPKTETNGWGTQGHLGRRDETVSTDEGSFPRALAHSDSKWPAHFIQRLLDLFFSWEYTSIALLYKEPFMRDFRAGDERYCSSALVNAILSLACQFLGDDGGDDESVNDDGDIGKGKIKNKSVDAAAGYPDKTRAGAIFFEEARAQLSWRQDEIRWQQQQPEKAGRESLSGYVLCLPDIQALGIMAIRQANYGNDVDACRLADECLALITGLCTQETMSPRTQAPPSSTNDDGDEQYLRVRAATYCGALSLTRLLRLATDLLSWSPGFRYTWQGNAGLEELVSSSQVNLAEVHSLQLNILRSQQGHQPQGPSLIPACLFDLMDCLYGFLAGIRPDGQEQIRVDPNDLVDVYQRCLRWYETVSDVLRSYSSQHAPFINFAYLYYHFCLLLLFRPFSYTRVPNSDLSPRDVCTESSHAILALTQSYRSMFSLRRAPAFLPHFVFAAGLAQLALEGNNDDGPPAQSQSQPQSQSHPREGGHRRPTSPSVTQAIHLLREMGPVHPVAVEAERVLSEQVSAGTPG